MRLKLVFTFMLTAVLLVQALPAGEIHDAALAGDMAKVKALLEKDPALVNAKGRNDKAPIHYAAQGGHLELVAFLLAKGAPVDSRNIANETPLGYAVGGGHLELVRFLLSKGADPNARSSTGVRAINIAAATGRVEIAELLADKGANLMEKLGDGRTLLHDAVLGGSLGLTRLMLDKGLSANAKTEAGQTPLLYAVWGGNMDIVKMLLSRGADPLERQRDGGTLLHAAALSGPPELARLLLDKGIPVDAKTEAGETALFSAAANGNKETAAVLTGKGADVNARNSQAEGPLFLALKFGHRDVAALLLNAGAKAEGSEKETGRTALHLAAAKGFGAVCSQLLAGDAAVNAVDLAGETPLVLAKRYGNDAIAAALTAKGATLGTAQVRPEPDAGLARPLAEGQAVVWYLGHSGWAVLTRNHFLIFDYAKSGELPDEPSLANGTISPAELKGMNVTVFASHAHGDHYVPAIWEWRKTIPNITYVLGFRPQEKETYSLLKSREKAELNGMEIIPIDSNDSGQGYFVKADGVAIFHPGDHANRQRDFSGPFKGEIDFLADAGLKADILFAPVFGCGFGDLVSVKKGVFYTIDRLSARSVFPMHAGGGETAFTAFAQDANNAGYGLPVCVARFNGDRFVVTPTEVKGAYSCPQNSTSKTPCANCSR